MNKIRHRQTRNQPYAIVRMKATAKSKNDERRRKRREKPQKKT